MNTLNAGDIIEARCTRCRDVLNHRIVAMIDDRIARVECNTCNGIHNYYPPPSEKAAKLPRLKSTVSARTTTGAVRAVKKSPLETERAEWASLRPTMSIEKAVDYSMTGKYRLKNLVNHPLFGLGIVKQIVTPTKMQVLFEDGIKLLRCG